jgi:hypothetical protein
MEQKLKFEFTVNEINTVLQGLGQLPFVQSVELINNIKQQAAPQVAQDKKKEE